MTDHKILNCDGIEFMENEVEDNSVDLVLVDPPYAISKDTGMDKFHKSVVENEGKDAKTEEDWNKYKKTLKKPKKNRFNLFYAFYIGKVRLIDNF